MSITATSAGSGSTFNSAVTHLNASAYNQAAGNTIVVFCESNAAAPGAISDTAGNTYIPISKLTFTGISSAFQAAWYCTNCKGNAANVISVVVSTSYGTIYSYDLAGVNALDPGSVSVGALGSGGNQNTTLTTAVAAEAVVSFIACTGASLSAATPPTGFTKHTAGILAEYSCAAAEVFSTLQSAVTETWATTGANAYVSVVGFYQSPDIVVPTFIQGVNGLTSTGSGTSFEQAFTTQNTTAGSLQIVVGVWNPGTQAGWTSVTDSQNNVWTVLPIVPYYGASHNTLGVQIAYSLNTAGGTKNQVTAHWGGSFTSMIGLALLEYSGVNALRGYDTVGAFGDGTAILSNGVTAVAGDLLIGYFGLHNQNSTALSSADNIRQFVAASALTATYGMVVDALAAVSGSDTVSGVQASDYWGAGLAVFTYVAPGGGNSNGGLLKLLGVN